MAYINPSADNVRAMLTESNGRLRKASAEYFALLEKGLVSSPLAVADQTKQFRDFMQPNVTATVDLGDKLIQAGDVRALTDQARNMGETAMKAMTAGSAPRR